MSSKIAAIAVNGGKILVSGNGLHTVVMKGEEKPADALRRKFGSSSIDYLGTADGVDVYLANPMDARGEWVDVSDGRLDPLREKIIPHLMWTGLL